MANKYAQSTGNWSAGGVGGIWYDAASGGSVVAKPTSGDNAYICSGAVVTINEDATADLIAPVTGTTGQIKITGSKTITAALTADYAGTFVLWDSGTQVLTINGSVAYSGTSTAGMLTYGTNQTLTIQNTGGAGTVSVTCSGTGYCILGSSGSCTVSNSGGTACLSSGNGVALRATGGSGNEYITGLISSTSGGTGVQWHSGGTSSTFAGTVSSSGTGTGLSLDSGVKTWTPGTGTSSSCTGAALYGVTITAGTVKIAGNLSTVQTSNTANRSGAIILQGGTVEWTGERTLAANTECSFYVRTGTLNLATASEALTLENSGTFNIENKAATLTMTAAGGTASIVNQTPTSYATIIGGTETQRGYITGPTIPAEEDVETAVEYGYEGDLQTGTLAGGGGGGGLLRGNKQAYKQ